MKLFLIVVLELTLFGLLFASAACAQEQQQFCTAQIETANAAAIGLRAPQLQAGLTQSPLIGSPAQGIVGVEESVGNLRRASATIAAGKAACQAYRTADDATLAVQWFGPAFQRNAMQHRIASEYAALIDLDLLLAENRTLLAAQNTTVQAIYNLETQRTKLRADIFNGQSTVAQIVIPDYVPNVQIDTLLAWAHAADVQAQQANVAVAKTQNWDVQIVAGARHSLFPFANASVGAYGGVSATWNLASRAANRHLMAAAEANAKFDTNRPGSPTQLAELLQRQVVGLAYAQRNRLAQIRTDMAAVQANLDSLTGIDTALAAAFRSSLKADLLLMRVEEQDAQFQYETAIDTLGANR